MLNVNGVGASLTERGPPLSSSKLRLITGELGLPIAPPASEGLITTRDTDEAMAAISPGH